MLRNVNIKELMIENAPLLVILIGTALIAFTLGPYQSYDTHLEFEAALNVIKTGVPYVQAYGTEIDQPPLGFYAEALFIRLFGLSVNTGVAIVTFFGIASIVLMYLLGKELYDKPTGIIAAALFGLNPWQLVLSRSFLIDTQCLFFSMFSLLIGILAIRRGSVRLALFSGVVFAFAIMTKFYAAFVLIPLFLFYVYSRPKSPKLVLSQLAAFSLPALMFALFWYQIILGHTLLWIFQHNDFADVVPASTGVITSPFFVANFLMNYGLGVCFIVAILFSLLLTFSLKKYFSRTTIVDAICISSAAFVLAINTILGAGLNLNVPYFSALKYDLQALPFLVLLGASLAVKGISIFKAAKSPIQPNKKLFYAISIIAAALLIASLISNMYATNALSTRDYLQYRVEPQVDYGYALLNPTPLAIGDARMPLQILGFATVLCSLMLVARQKVLMFGSKLKGSISAGYRIVNMGTIAENMTDQPTSRFRAMFNRWRVGLIVFAAVYGTILLLSLTHHPMDWDEVIHLNGALNLISGHFNVYVSNAFYPPLLDSATALSFNLVGVSLFSARLVSALFSLLSLWVVFELAYAMYGGKVGLLSAVLLSLMPGYFWLSRITLLETMLLFFILLALFSFYLWMKNKKDRYLVFSGLAVGLGFLTKYQAIIAGAIMVVSILFFARGQLKHIFSRFSILVVTAFLVVVPWIVAAYQMYASKLFSQWFYAIQVGNPQKALYSDRYPFPIFYFIDLVWPYDTFHPISIFLYIVGLAGLVFLVLRHNKNDKFLLIWFVSVFIFFTLIANKEWRYVLPVFPVLSISAAMLILFGYAHLEAWKKRSPASKQRQRKLVAGLFVVVVASAMAYSIYDTYSITSYFDVTIQLEPATVYAMNRMQNNQSIMVMCPFNFFSQDMIQFYLTKNGNTQISVYQYPALPVDTYTINFNITELIFLCKQENVKYLFTYENGGTTTYYNSTINLVQLYQQIYASGNFSQWTYDATFGVNPRRIMILTYLG